MSESFVWHRRGRWFWVNLTTIIVLTIFYFDNHPIGGRSGATWLGYTYGFIATAGIAYLMWYGMRKRAYYTSSNTLKGCLSAHIWLGVSLAIIVPLHAGFSYGMNLHTLAYVLMDLVIASGIYGAIQYSNTAQLIAAHRGGGHSHQLLEQLERLSKEIAQLVSTKSAELRALQKQTDFNVQAGVWACLRRELVPYQDQKQLTDQLAALAPSEYEDGLKLLSLVTRKREVALRLQEDVRTLTKLRIWLWIHLPASCALLVAVMAHIYVVFLYR